MEGPLTEPMTFNFREESSLSVDNILMGPSDNTLPSFDNILPPSDNVVLVREMSGESSLVGEPGFISDPVDNTVTPSSTIGESVYMLPVNKPIKLPIKLPTKLPIKPISVESSTIESTFGTSTGSKVPKNKRKQYIKPVQPQLIKSHPIDSFSSDFSSQTDNSDLPVAKNERLNNIKSVTIKDRPITTFKMGPPK